MMRFHRLMWVIVFMFAAACLRAAVYVRLTRRACSHPSDWEVWLTKCLRFSRVLHYSWSREACVRQTFFYFSLVNNSCGCTHVNSRQTSEVLGATLKPGLDFWGPPGHRPWMWTCNITARKDPRNDEGMMGLFNLRSDLSDHYFWTLHHIPWLK